LLDNILFLTFYTGLLLLSRKKTGGARGPPGPSPCYGTDLTKQSESPEILSLSLCRLTDHLAVVIYSTQEQVHKFRKFIVLEEQYWDYRAFNSTETLYSTKWLQYSLLNTLISIFLHGRKNSLLFYSTPQHANPKT